MTSDASLPIGIIGSCGISCEKCACRLATIRQDMAEKEEVARKWSKIYDIPITSDMISCSGCQESGVKFMFPAKGCVVRPCVMSRNLQTCASCDEYPCPKIEALHAHSPKGHANIEKLREKQTT